MLTIERNDMDGNLDTMSNHNMQKNDIECLFQTSKTELFYFKDTFAYPHKFVN